MDTITLIISQLIFSFSRTLNVRYTSRDMVFMSLLTSTIIKVSWLVSTYLGVSAIFNEDYLTAVVYVLSGVIGDYASFRVKIK